MSRWLKLAPLLAVVMTLAACETVPPLPPGTVLLAGLTRDDLRIAWGVPDDIAIQADQTELWTYHNAWVAHNGNTYTSHWSGSSDSDYVGGGDKHHVHTSYYDPEFVPLTVSDEYCDVRVHVGADRRVQSVEFEGNCDSYRKKAEDLHRAVLMPASSSSSSVAGASRGG